MCSVVFTERARYLQVDMDSGHTVSSGWPRTLVRMDKDDSEIGVLVFLTDRTR